MTHNVRLASKLSKKLFEDYYLSEHFQAHELACRCCGKVYVTPVLMEMLEKLRNRAGVPLFIASGYRCPEHNKEIHGAERSKHMLGMAADIKIPVQYVANPEEFCRIAEEIVQEVKGGFHFYPAGHFIHMDYWADPPNRRW